MRRGTGPSAFARKESPLKVFLTGPAGFIGSHVAESFLADGHEVVGVDNFDPFYPRQVKQDNLAGFAGHERFTFVEADLAEMLPTEDAWRKHGPFDVVLHLAAKAGVRPSIADPLAYERANVAATMNLLELAVKAETKPKFVFASSSSVYGNSPTVPFGEDQPVDRPISPYAATKKACELISHTYHHLYGLDVSALRFFTVYGPRQRPDLAIMKFAKMILAGQTIQMFGDGASSRDYTYIDDIVAGVRAACDRCEGYEIINLGSKSPIDLKTMIATVEAACGVPAKIEQLPMQPGDVDRTFADTTKAERLLDYHPSMDFAEGVRRQVAWLTRA